jgi:hypothetical protein
LTYTFDTTVLIGFGRNYPRDVFPTLWDTFEQSVDRGEVCACQAVLDELERGTDELYDWAKRYPHLVCDATQADIDLATEISSAFPDWVREDTNAGDPFVIAHAIVEDRTIVTDEKMAGRGVEPRNQKIPNVAAIYQVATIDFFGFARAEGWKF